MLKVYKMSLGNVASALESQFGLTHDKAIEYAMQVKQASRTGSLVWTNQKLITTDRSRLNLWTKAEDRR